MKSQKLFALTGEVRGAARVVYGDIGGTLAVELSPRGAGAYEAWIAGKTGPLLRAPLGAALSALLPAGAKDADCVFITQAGRIVASGANGFSRSDMEKTALRVSLAIAKGADKPKTEQPQERLQALQAVSEEPSAVQEAVQEVVREAAQEAVREVAQAQAVPQGAYERATIPASRAADYLIDGMPDAWKRREQEKAAIQQERQAQILREASVDPQLRSEAALSILTVANSLFHPVRAEDANSSYVEQKAAVRNPVPNNVGASVRPSMANAAKPVKPAQRNGAYQPAHSQRMRGPRGRPCRPR